MNRNDEVYKVGLALHGHKCPAMPLGLARRGSRHASPGCAARAGWSVDRPGRDRPQSLLHLLCGWRAGRHGLHLRQGQHPQPGLRQVRPDADRQQDRAQRARGGHTRSHAPQPGIGIHQVTARRACPLRRWMKNWSSR